MQNISSTLLAPAAAVTERRRYLAFAFCWADLLFELRDGQIVYAAGAVESLLGYSPERLVGRNFQKLIHSEDRALVQRLLHLIAAFGRLDEASCRVLRPRGDWRRVSLAGHSLAGAFGESERGGGAALAGGAESHFIAMKLRFDKQEDLLAGDASLLTPERFAELAAQRLAMNPGGASAPLLLLDISESSVADIDGDRRLNWDAALAACLRAHALDGRLATRIDRRRFGLLGSSEADALSLRREIEALSRSVLSGAAQNLSLEVESVASGDLGTVSENDLARGLLYTLRSFEKQRESDLSLSELAGSLDGLVAQAATNITRFKTLIGARNFRFVMQPIIELATGEVDHYEVLCRFQDAKGEQSPATLIAFAEETGLIQDFDLAMVEQVLAWLEKRPINARRHKVAVNLSGASILHGRFRRQLLALLSRYEGSAERLSFEVTETAQIDDLPRANAFLRLLRRRGFKICLDDFGAGAASFRYLNTLEVDAVKLDGGAITFARRSMKGYAFLSALTELCRKMGVATVAEMVEDRETLDFVRECGCDYVQGYFFGKPSADLRRFSPYPNRGLLRGQALFRQ